MIGIETNFPEGYKGRTKKQVQFTYGTFELDESNNQYKLKVIKQQLLYNKTIFDLNDLYGIDNTPMPMENDF